MHDTIARSELILGGQRSGKPAAIKVTRRQAAATS